MAMGARCPRFAPVFWALTWAPPYSAGHVRSVTSRALCEGWDSTLPRATAFLPNLFHHIFLVRSSQTCTAIGAKIPRQCTIENCARLQRRTHSSLRVPEESFSPLFDNIWPRSAHPQVHAKQQKSMLSPIF